MKRVAISSLFLCGLLLVGCEQPESSSSPIQTRALPVGVIGQIEPVVVYPHGVTMEARIDTGATTSSIDARDITEFERDGKKWVRFFIEDRQTQERHPFEARVVRIASITQHGREDIKRPVVKLTISMGSVVLKREFSLANRHNFMFPVLIGRNVLQDQAIVDVSLTRTLTPEIVNE